MSGESFAPELFWLALTCLLAGVIWMPYIVDRIMVRGMMPALGYEGPDANPHSAWTVRLVAAHKNLIEKLVIFGPVVIALIITGQTGIGTAVAAMIFFFARVAHAVIMATGIPMLRILAYATGSFATLYLIPVLPRIF